MKFSEKIQKLRKAAGLSQAELAGKIGVSARSVASYEAGTSRPRYRKTYELLAGALGVHVNFLYTEDEEDDGYAVRPGTTAQQQARNILGEVRQLFSGGELSDEDQIAFLTEMQQMFLDSKPVPRRFSLHPSDSGEQDS